MSRYIFYCVCSQCLFGSLYLFSYYMQPLSGSHIFALRMVTMWFGLVLLIICFEPKRAFFRFLFFQLGRNWRKWVWMLLGTLILTS